MYHVVHLYVNAFAALQYIYTYNFYNMILKIKHKLYMASGSAPPQRKNAEFTPDTRKTST